MTEFNTSTPLIALDAVALDTETTGLDARVARIIQLGAVRIKGGRIESGEQLDQLVNPGVPIPPQTTAVHGIADADVADAPMFPQVAERLAAYLQGAVLVGHTVSYDRAMLEREHELMGRAWRAPRMLDVRLLARLANPSLPDYSLDKLCAWLDVEIKGRHTALGDALATAEVFVALVPLLRQRGIRTIAEAERASVTAAEKEALATGGRPVVVGGDAETDVKPLSRIDSFPYRHRIADIMSAPPLFIPADATLHAAMQLLIARKVSSALVRLPEGLVGIVTERDVLRATARDGAAALELPVGGVASVPLQTVSAGDFVYRAIGRIERLGFRHLGVADADGTIVGVVTSRNLLRHRATTAIVLGDEIDEARDSAALAGAWSKVPTMARHLLDEGVEPRTICAVISAEICQMTRRAAELAEAAMIAEGFGEPPVPYAVMVLGSGGRGESQLAADQDNAIVYAHGEEAGREDAYFAALGARMCETLDQAGIPFCKGGVMAKNREWRMSVADWTKRIDGWVRRQSPEDFLNVDIFFDALPVHGDRRLADDVRGHAFTQGRAVRSFLKFLAIAGAKRGNPFTLLGGFRVDGEGRIDLKAYGLMPAFSAARVLAIKNDVRVRGTLDRLRACAEKGALPPERADAIGAAQSVIFGAVLAQQLEDAKSGRALSPRVAPSMLSKTAASDLKKALRMMEEATGLIDEGLQ